MKNYEDFQLSKWREYCAEKMKGMRYAKEYFEQNGKWASIAAVAANAKLTPEEAEAKRASDYAAGLTSNIYDFDDIVPPAETENTPEQEAAAEDVVSKIMSGEKTIAVEGELNNLTIPAECAIIPTISAKLVDGATIKNESAKVVVIENTGEPVSVVIEGGNKVNLRGEYNDIYLNGKMSVSSSQYPTINGTVTVDPAVIDSAVTISAVWNEGSKVEYYNDQKLNITSANENSKVVVNAPNATVDMGGKYADVDVTAGENTLILKAAFHANNLNVRKGNVVFYGLDINDFADNFVAAEGVVASPYTVDVTAANFGKIVSNPGVYNIAEDIENTACIAYGLFANGKTQINLCNHTVKNGNTRNGCMFLRGSAEVNFYGPGAVINNQEGYGVWVSSADATLNVFGGDFQAYTHVLYAENGAINIYGGTFRMLGTQDLDVNGHAKFLLNCLDKSYTAGTAKINVYGGKFYNFNPAESYGEPNGPVSFVAEGYHVVESVEDGVPVFEVVKDE